VRAGAGAVLAAVMLFRPSAPLFVYDAAVYWAGTRAVLDGGDVFEQGRLGLRGVLTSMLYLPAAAVTKMGGESWAGPAVLVENAVLIALIGVVLVPQLVGLWRPVTPLVVAASAVGTGILTAGFAPFPLTDLWGAALLLSAVVALGRRSPAWLAGAGLAAGAAVNIRPALLLPLAVVGVAVVVARRWSALWCALGAAVALAPQFLLNRSRGTTWVPWPETTAELTRLQASYAAYVVRYDTVVGDAAVDPRRFFCSPAMADALDGSAPSSTGELAGSFLAHLPQAVVLAAQKIAAALHWPLSTPYTSPAPVVNGLFALLVTAVTVVGAAVLLHRALTRRRDLGLGQVTLVLAWLGCAANLVTSATESRFALPLVLAGVAGCVVLVADGVRVPRGRTGRAWVAGTVLAVLAVFAVGVTGLQHPVSGPVTLATCEG
jgi:hypothetical protein